MATIVEQVSVLLINDKLLIITNVGEYLYFHRILVQPTDKNYLNGMWGKLAAEILMQDWDTALEDLNRLVMLNMTMFLPVLWRRSGQKSLTP